MMVELNIENANTNSVESINVKEIYFDRKNESCFDISTLTNKELDKLVLAIDTTPETNYIDIEMFFIEHDPYPNFGSDYNYNIINNRLYCKNIYYKEEN